MYRQLAFCLPLCALLALGLGCGRKSETHDPDLDRPPTVVEETEIMEEPVAPPDDDTTDPGYAPPNGTPNDTDDDSVDTADDTTGTAQVCTPEWFVWVNEQVQLLPNSQLADLYPGGLPEVGSDEWFVAVDRLTGGDGAHGPDGGSDEWCNMVLQRLGQMMP